MEKKYFQHIKRLIIALTISGCLNILLLLAIFYVVFKEISPLPYCEQKPLTARKRVNTAFIDQSNAELLRKFRALSTHQLNMRLYSQKLIENGYTERDLALACLVSLHHFDLVRALSGFPEVLQSRAIAYGKKKDGSIATMTVYPQLSSAHFEAIIKFAKTERWPYNSEGLFLLLQGSQEHKDKSLVHTFMLTPEFTAVETLLNRSQTRIAKHDILNILLDGEWQTLQSFRGQQRLAQDLSAERRQQFLVEYIEKGSVIAAEVLLNSDFTFALIKLDNTQIFKLLHLLQRKSDIAIAFVKALRQSPRGDVILALADKRLAEFGIEKKMVSCEKANAATELTSKQALPHMLVRKDQLYIVQDGDNLWKLSRRFKINIDTIRAYNQLQSDSLKPGTPLRIPQQ